MTKEAHRTKTGYTKSPSEQKVLILDIEADSLDIFHADTKVVGVWNNISNEIQYIWKGDFDRLKKMIKESDFVVTFNGTRYDFPVLMNERCRLFKYETTFSRKHIDMYPIFKTKRTSLFNKKFTNGFSLDAVCETLGIGRKQADFDYSILQREEFTEEEKAEIEKYLHQDIVLTRDLWLFLEDFFSTFKEFLPPKSVEKKHHITTSTASLAYKAVCYAAGLEEKYNERQEENEVDESYKGGGVRGPYRSHARGEIRCVDYTSAYPHAYMQGNLYTHCGYDKHGACPHGRENSEGCPHKFTGGTTRDGHKLELFGSYCTRAGMGVIERVIQKFFLMRLDAKQELKKLRKSSLTDQETLDRISYLDKYQQALKIIINTIYGISGSARFLQVFDIDTAQDCTKICRFNLDYMHWRLGQAGYIVLYGDTDSAYILIPTDHDITEEEREEINKRLEEVLQDIIKSLQEIFPFPQETFNIDIEDEISYAQYFSDGAEGWKKKLYILLQRDGKVKVKGLSVVRSDSSLLAREIWKKKSIPYIQEHQDAIIPKAQLQAWVDDLLNEDMSLVAVEFNVQPTKYYSNPNQLQAQISAKLGEGRHFLVRYKGSTGIGKGVKYITMEEAKEVSKQMIDVSRTYSDLSDLILNTQATTRDAFERLELTEDEQMSLEKSATKTIKRKERRRRNAREGTNKMDRKR